MFRSILPRVIHRIRTRLRNTRVWLTAGATITALCPSFPVMAAVVHLTGSSVGIGDPGIVYHGEQLLPFMQATRAQRVDIAGIGDSNQIIFGDYGHSHGQQKAWADQVGLYGSG